MNNEWDDGIGVQKSAAVVGIVAMCGVIKNPQFIDHEWLSFLDTAYDTIIPGGAFCITRCISCTLQSP